MMKLVGCLFLLILISKSVGLDDDEILDGLFKRRDSKKRFQSPHSEEDLLESLLPEAKRLLSKDGDDSSDDSPSSNVKDPIRVAIFNAGSYNARLKLNYVVNGVQYEEQLRSTIQSGQHRSLFVPGTATYLRVRVNKGNNFNDNFIIDDQIHDLTDSTGYCYLLANTNAYPVYGICPSTYKNMLEDWGALE